jgi:hypothetical protein
MRISQDEFPADPKKESIMKKTSRRSFGRSVAAALAAIPVATFASESTFTAQTRKSSSTVLGDNRSHENTPPPIDLADGSFSVLMKTNSATPPLTESGSGPYTYKGKVAPSTKNSFEHIKILHGSGEQVYRDLDAADSEVAITLRDETDGDAGRLVVSCVSDEINIVSTGYGSGPANGQLQPSYKPGRPHHKHTLTHQGGPGNKEFRITAIKITKRGATPLDLALNPVGSGSNQFESQGFRILLWLKE